MAENVTIDRKADNRKTRYTGVHQRCYTTCAERCYEHKFGYHYEAPRRDGRRLRFNEAGFDTAKEAYDARRKIVEQQEAGTLPAAGNARITVGEYFPKWLDGRLARKEIQGTTGRGYSDNITLYIAPKLGHLRLRDLRGTQLTDFYLEIMRERVAEIAAVQALNEMYAAQAEQINADRQARGKTRMMRAKRLPVPRPLSANSVQRVHAVVCGALKDAVPEYLSLSVAPHARLPRVDEVKMQPPTPQQFADLLRATAGERLFALLVVGGFTGWRRGELAALRWNHVDLATGAMQAVWQRVADGAYSNVVERKVKTKAGQDRTAVLEGDPLTVLRIWRERQQAEQALWDSADHDEAYYTDEHGGYVFCQENGQPYHPDYLSKVVVRWMKAAGLDAGHLHLLRHMWAHLLISAGYDLAMVKELIGHSSYSFTVGQYGGVFNAQRARAATDAANLVPWSVERPQVPAAPPPARRTRRRPVVTRVAHARSRGQARRTGAPR